MSKPRTPAASTAASESKKFKHNCRYVFNDAEKLDIGRSMADAQARVDQLENDKKQVVKDFDAKIALAEAERSSACQKIATGYEYRLLDCVALFNTPKPGRKTIKRVDNGETVSVEDMTQDDMQRTLPVED